VSGGVRQVRARPAALTTAATHYCPGCTHGLATRLIAEVIDELGLRGRAIGIGSVGCSVFSYRYLDVDFLEAAHGRAPAVATGVKRVRPEAVVFTIQGDGDLASIGAAEILHAAARGESITVVFLNNAIYGMTGGQMAPTTLLGQVTTSTPDGRDRRTGGPLHLSEMLALAPGAAYVARRSLHDPVAVARAKQALRKAFEVQLRGEGLALVELLSACPTNWGLDPTAALAFVRDAMTAEFPVGDLKGGEAA
jgi:2-oxoglutarate/2-oxoacid ferredoxin oxidoreductase subunit beta